MRHGFALNSNDILDHKLTERMNDIVKALTRQMADRLDTKKSFRVFEKQLKNIFEIVVF